MIKCRYDGDGVWSGRCVGTKEVDPCPGHEKCERFTAEYVTNADRIRAMSDFELRQFICGSNRCEICRWSAAHGCKLMEWLKQPAEEDE